MKQSDVATQLASFGIENATGEARQIWEALSTKPFTSFDPTTSEAGIDEVQLAYVINRRKAHYPLQYLLGVAWFYGECYEVSPDCLIPRSDTEHIVDYAIHHLPRGAHFLDMCTGSGCIAISILAHRPDCKATAIDISPAALAIAKRNAERNHVSDRITFLEADALSYLPPHLYDGMTANPPYIRHNALEHLQTEVKSEPLLALDGGEDGLVFYRHFCKNLPYYIYKEGFCVFEIGFDQAKDLETLAHEYHLDYTCQKDYHGEDRVVVVKLTDQR